MRFDPAHPHNTQNDRFVLSKGHAAPLLYAAWAAVGFFPRSSCSSCASSTTTSKATRRRVSTSSTSRPGRSVRACPQRSASRSTRAGSHSDYRTYVLMGDGETAEGSVWEAAESAAALQAGSIWRHHRRESTGPEPADHVAARHGGLCAALARLRVARHRHRRPRSGRHSRCLAEARATKGQPTMILAKHAQGQGHLVRAGQGRLARKRVEDGESDKAVAELKATLKPVAADAVEALRKAIPPTDSARGAGRCSRETRAAGLQAWRPGRDARGVRQRAGQARTGRLADRRARRRRGQFHFQRPVREGSSRAVLRVLHRRAGDGRRGDGPGSARRHPVPVHVRLLPVAGVRLHPHGRHQQPEHQARRIARRRVDRRGRPVADGARRSRDDASRAELHRAVSKRRDVRGTLRGAGRLPRGAGVHPHQPAEDARACTTPTRASPSAARRCSSSRPTTPSLSLAPA